jgi:hypothetical protein
MVDHKWIDTTKLTPGIGVYYQLFRVYSQCSPVTILRNPFDVNSGIYIVGDTQILESVEESLLKLIPLIESKANRKKFRDKNIHLSKQRSEYKSLLVRVACTVFIKDLGEFEASLGPEHVWQKANDKILREEYIEQTPTLRALKPFK